MKHSFTAAILFTLAALAVLAVRAHAQRQVASAAGQGSAPAAPAAPTAAPAPTQDGNVLIAQAAHEMRNVSSLEAKVRVQSFLYGQELSGAGVYYQLVKPPETLFKLELKLQVANQVSSLLNVSDGRFIWTRRDLPNSKTLSRIDQRRINESLARASKQAPISTSEPMFMLAGLGRMLESLCGHFTFDAPTQESISGVRVWVLSGQWRPEVLASLWPEQAKAAGDGSAPLADAPPQMPTHVRLVLAADPAQKLVPYRIEYQRVDTAGRRVPLLVLDYYDIRQGTALDPRLFVYKPGDQEVKDDTEQWMRNFGL